jgi:hypothetical protein
MARAVPHGHAQGYADVRGTGQAIHRAELRCLACILETRSRLRSAMAALRLSWPRFAGFIHASNSIGKNTPTRLQYSIYLHLGTTLHPSPAVILQPQHA